MRICILYSSDDQMNFLNHLCNICDACDYCTHCRPSSLNFTQYLYHIFKIKNDLPVFVENPENYLPEIPACDLVIALNIHPDLLLELPYILPDTVKGVIIPADSPDWVKPGLRGQLQKVFAPLHIEYAFPKPYCSLDYTEEHPFINEVITHLRIGNPKMDITIKDGIVTTARCIQSAPCGSTWYICEQLKNVPVAKVLETVAAAHHAYPCNASMAEDPELKDTILHKAGYLVREAAVTALHQKGIEVDLTQYPVIQFG
ncbi:MAG: DUF166 family protein [Candidatus Methanofastidiosia archaeon]